MTLEDLARDVAERNRDWADKHIAELDAVSNNPKIARQIVTFIEEAAKHPRSITGKPSDAVKSALKLTGLSNFRFGLLVGLLLWKPEPELAEQTDPTTKQESLVGACQACWTSGIVCHGCGLHASKCTCGLGEFSPVKCEECNGEGWV